MITRTVVRSGGGGGSGSSLPSRVDYAYIVAKAKVGLDDAITGTTSWSFKMAMGTASADISTDTQLNGCIYIRAGGILAAKYSDGADACTYIVAGGWAATDELIIVLYANGPTAQIGIIDNGAYSWGTAVDLVYPKVFAGFGSGTIAFPYTAPAGYLCWIPGYNAALDPGWDGDVGWDGPLDGRAKPRNLFSGSADAWFESDGEQRALSNTTIAALPGINLEKGTKFFDTDTNIGYLEYSEKLPKAVEKTVFYAMGITHHDYELLWNYTDDIASDVGADATVTLVGVTWAGASTVLPVSVDNGVGVFPEYTQMLVNSGYINATGGAYPGAVAPTGWTINATAGVITIDSQDRSITFDPSTANRMCYSQSLACLANTTYRFRVQIEAFQSLSSSIVYSRINAVPVGTTSPATCIVDGVEISVNTAIATGIHTIEYVIPIGATAGNVEIRVGNTANYQAKSKVWPAIFTRMVDAPYLASPVGATSTSVSTAGSATNGVSFDLDSENIAALEDVCTIAALFNPADASTLYSTSQNILTTSASATQGITINSGGVLSVSDGTNTASVTIASGFSKYQKIAVAMRVNANNTLQAGYCKVATETTFTWGTAAPYAGSVAQTGKLILGYEATIPFYVGAAVIWAKTASDAEILLGMEKALA